MHNLLLTRLLITIRETCFTYLLQFTEINALGKGTELLAVKGKFRAACNCITLCEWIYYFGSRFYLEREEGGGGSQEFGTEIRV